MLAVVYKKTHVDVHTKEFLTNTLTEHYSVGKDRDAVAITWDQIMGNFQCCGVMDHTDFVKAKNFINTSNIYNIILISIYFVLEWGGKMSMEKVRLVQ